MLRNVLLQCRKVLHLFREGGRGRRGLKQGRHVPFMPRTSLALVPARDIDTATNA